MKFKTLAIAIAAATVSTAAMADGHMGAPEFKISGDITVGYFDLGGVTSFDESGSEINFDASQKVGGNTYYAHTEVDFQGDGNAAQMQEVRVGVKGAWGDLMMGEGDNGCDTMDIGWVADDMFISHSSGGCKAGDKNNFVYKGSRGPVSYSVGYSPEVDGTGSVIAGKDVFSAGIKGTFGPVGASLGYESESLHTFTRIADANHPTLDAGEEYEDKVAGGHNIVLGLTGNVGPVSVGIRANKFENEDQNGEDVYVGYTAQYAARGNKFYAGYGVIGDDANTTFLGYNRSIGSNTTLIAEYVNIEGAAKDLYAVGVQHSF